MSETGRFGGRLFGPGLPGGGVRGEGVWIGPAIRVVADDGSSFHGSTPTVRSGGFNAGSLHLEWQNADGSWVFVVDEAHIPRCRASAPPVIQSRLHEALGSRRRIERRFRAGWVLLGLALLMPLGLFALFISDSDRFARWVVDRIPVEQEARLGDLVVAQSRLQFTLRDSGPAVDAVRKIGEPLTAGTRHRYRWFIAERPDVNAFAAPGGVVVVFSGLLEKVESPEELAGVLAHEIAHAELRHSLTIMVKSLGIRSLVALLTGDLSGDGFVEFGTRLLSLSYSREAEREADREGFRRIVSARIDPAGMIRFYEKLGAISRLEPPAILSTHPATGERLDWLRQAAAGHKGPRMPLEVDITPFRTIRGR